MKSILPFILIFMLVSCKVVSKKHLKENYQTKIEASAQKTELSLETKNSIDSLSVSIDKKINSVSEKIVSSEKENTIVSGTIEPEIGKKKSVSFGGNKIVSDGAKVKFLISSSKEKDVQVEKLKQHFSERLDYYEKEFSCLKSDYVLLSEQFLELEKRLERQEKDKTKKTVNFPWWILIVIIGIAILYYLYKNTDVIQIIINILKRLFSWLKK